MDAREIQSAKSKKQLLTPFPRVGTTERTSYLGDGWWICSVDSSGSPPAAWRLLLVILAAF